MPATRIDFADTNWLFSTCYQTRERAEVARWAAQPGPQTTVVSEAVLAECRCNFWRAGDRFGAPSGVPSVRLIAALSALMRH